MSNPLKYSSCWEDAYLLEESLEVNEQSEVLSIASAGDNSLYLLSKNPKSMTCIDMNPIQIYVCQLKEAAVKHLSFQEFEQLLGFVPSESRIDIFKMLLPHLPADCVTFFNQNPLLITEGLIHQGKLEKYFQLFASKVLPLIHKKETVRQLFTAKSEQKQAAFYSKTWNNWRWKGFFRLFFSKVVMGLLGREKEKMKYVEGKVGKLIFASAQEHLKSKNCQNNYILKYILTGNYGSERPPYSYSKNFAKAKQWLQVNEIEYGLADLESWLKTGKKYNSFNLSNIFEYMSENEFGKNIQVVENASLPKSKLCFWNLMVPRSVAVNSTFVEHAAVSADLGFFYRKFHFLQQS